MEHAPEPTYTLADIFAKLGTASEDELRAHFKGFADSKAVRMGAEVATPRIVTDAPHILGAAMVFIQGATSSQLDWVGGSRRKPCASQEGRSRSPATTINRVRNPNDWRRTGPRSTPPSPLGSRQTPLLAGMCSTRCSRASCSARSPSRAGSHIAPRSPTTESRLRELSAVWLSSAQRCSKTGTEESWRGARLHSSPRPGSTAVRGSPTSSAPHRRRRAAFGPPRWSRNRKWTFAMVGL